METNRPIDYLTPMRECNPADAMDYMLNYGEKQRVTSIEIELNHLRREIVEINKKLANQSAEQKPSIERTVHLERENARLSYEVRSLKEKVLALVKYISGEDND